MKYSITINQAGIVDAGFGNKTDLIDWAIVDYIMGWQAAPNAARIGQHVWLNLKHLAAEMPLLGISTKSALSRRITKLVDLEILTKQQDDFGRLYVSLSHKGHGIIVFRAVAQTPTPLPTEQQGVADGTTGCCSGNNGVLLTEQHSVVNPLLVNPVVGNQDITPSGSVDKNSGFDEWWSYYPKKKAKEDAKKAWVKNECYKIAQTLISDVINRSANDSQWQDKQFVPNGATYLNGKRWEDDIIPKNQKKGSAHDLSTQVYTEGSF